MLTQERLKELLRYDAKTGKFYRIKGVRGYAAGSLAGSKTDKGYTVVMLEGARYRAGRLAWLWVTGSFPKNEIDHKDGVRDNDRFGNLREATRSENLQNIAKGGANTSGLLGVSFDKINQKWKAQIKQKGTNLNLGRYATREEAHRAYLTAKKRLHAFQPAPRVGA